MGYVYNINEMRKNATNPLLKKGYFSEISYELAKRNVKLNNLLKNVNVFKNAGNVKLTKGFLPVIYFKGYNLFAQTSDFNYSYNADNVGLINATYKIALLERTQNDAEVSKLSLFNQITARMFPLYGLGERNYVIKNGGDNGHIFHSNMINYIPMKMETVLNDPINTGELLDIAPFFTKLIDIFHNNIVTETIRKINLNVNLKEYTTTIDSKYLNDDIFNVILPQTLATHAYRVDMRTGEIIELCKWLSENTDIENFVDYMMEVNKNWDPEQNIEIDKLKTFTMTNFNPGFYSVNVLEYAGDFQQYLVNVGNERMYNDELIDMLYSEDELDREYVVKRHPLSNLYFYQSVLKDAITDPKYSVERYIEFLTKIYAYDVLSISAINPLKFIFQANVYKEISEYYKIPYSVPKDTFIFISPTHSQDLKNIRTSITVLCNMDLIPLQESFFRNVIVEL